MARINQSERALSMRHVIMAFVFFALFEFECCNVHVFMNEKLVIPGRRFLSLNLRDVAVRKHAVTFFIHLSIKPCESSQKFLQTNLTARFL